MAATGFEVWRILGLLSELLWFERIDKAFWVDGLCRSASVDDD